MNNKEIAISWAAAAAIMSPAWTLKAWAEWIWGAWKTVIDWVGNAVNNVLDYAWVESGTSSLNIWATSGLAMPLAAWLWGWMVSQYVLDKFNIQNNIVRYPLITAWAVWAISTPLAPFFAATAAWVYGYKWWKWALKWLWKGLWKAWDWGKPANNSNYKKEEAA